MKTVLLANLPRTALKWLLSTFFPFVTIPPQQFNPAFKHFLSREVEGTAL